MKVDKGWKTITIWKDKEEAIVFYDSAGAQALAVFSKKEGKRIDTQGKMMHSGNWVYIFGGGILCLLRH